MRRQPVYTRGPERARPGADGPVLGSIGPIVWSTVLPSWIPPELHCLFCDNPADWFLNTGKPVVGWPLHVPVCGVHAEALRPLLRTPAELVRVVFVLWEEHTAQVQRENARQERLGQLRRGADAVERSTGGTGTG